MKLMETKIYKHFKFSDYGCDSKGIIYSFKFNKKKIHKTFIRKEYSVLDVRVDEIKYRMQAHRFIFECFYGEIKGNKVIDHINNKKHDNRIENLQAITQKENHLKYYKENFKNISGLPKGIYNVKNKWKVVIHVGTFETLEEAIRIRNQYC